MKILVLYVDANLFWKDGPRWWRRKEVHHRLFLVIKLFWPHFTILMKYYLLSQSTYMLCCCLPYKYGCNLINILNDYFTFMCIVNSYTFANPIFVQKQCCRWSIEYTIISVYRYTRNGDICISSLAILLLYSVSKFCLYEHGHGAIKVLWWALLCLLLLHVKIKSMVSPAGYYFT